MGCLLATKWLPDPLLLSLYIVTQCPFRPLLAMGIPKRFMRIANARLRRTQRAAKPPRPRVVGLVDLSKTKRLPSRSPVDVSDAPRT